MTELMEYEMLMLAWKNDKNRIYLLATYSCIEAGILLWFVYPMNLQIQMAKWLEVEQ